jgi:hypothetical protein
MFEHLVKRSDWVSRYTTGPFVKERCLFLRDLYERGQSLSRLGIINRLLLAVAERVDLYQCGLLTKDQVIRAARDWIKKCCVPSAKEETRRRRPCISSLRTPTSKRVDAFTCFGVAQFTIDRFSVPCR